LRFILTADDDAAPGLDPPTHQPRRDHGRSADRPEIGEPMTTKMMFLALALMALLPAAALAYPPNPC
jgi:hypothetical protein